MWNDDGLVVRFPDTDEPPDPRLLLPDPDDVEALVLRQLGATSLFAAKFREAAARALLLPRRRIGGRTPLWQQRKRAADLLAVAAKFGSFPMLLEAYRECLRDLFDVPALIETLRAICERRLRVVTVDSTTPSPFAASLLFGYVAQYLYDGDAPLAERRAQALSIDHAQLKALLGDAELRDVLDREAIDDVERELQHLAPERHVKSIDGIHDLLLRLGDLNAGDVAIRCALPNPFEAIDALVEARRALRLPIAGATRLVAVEDASRYRDALGTPLPAGLPMALLEPVRDPLLDLVMRYARTHGPFTTGDVARHFALGEAAVDKALRRAVGAGRLHEGDFRPGGTHREWCEPGVLGQIRRRSLAKVRHQVEPVEPATLGRLVTTWQGVTRKRRGLDALLDTVETLQGAPLVASLLESEILPARIDGYEPGDLDTLLAAGEVVWAGVEPLGDKDGRLALFLGDALPRLWRPPAGTTLGPRQQAIADHLQSEGASFFAAIHDAAGGGFPRDTVDALWDLVWRGLATNDALQAVRAFVGPSGPKLPRSAVPRVRATGRVFRSRRQVPPSAEGRWSLVGARVSPVSPTEWSTALAQQLLTRYGVVTREVAAAESIPGGFSAVYDVLRALDESGRVRRGFFVGGVGATQFALPPALDLLRSLRQPPEDPEAVMLGAADPANPYGTLLKWPSRDTDAAASREPDAPAPLRRGPTRTVGARVVLVDGACVAHVSRGGRQILTWLPEAEPDRSRAARALAGVLAAVARTGEGRDGGLLVSDIDTGPAHEHPLAPFLLAAGFVRSGLGYQVRRERRPEPPPAAGDAADRPSARHA
jgi:ATP-dependent helicase Lhr and Lhr-like helicase